MVQKVNIHSITITFLTSVPCVRPSSLRNFWFALSLHPLLLSLWRMLVYSDPMADFVHPKDVLFALRELSETIGV